MYSIFFDKEGLNTIYLFVPKDESGTKHSFNRIFLFSHLSLITAIWERSLFETQTWIVSTLLNSQTLQK